MTTTPEKISDLLRCFQNLQRLFEAYVDAINSISRHSLQFSLAIESHLLLMKLTQTVQRWSDHLPFFEFQDVEFTKWGETLRNWDDYMAQHALRNEYISYKPFVPDVNFYIDLIDAIHFSGESDRHYAQMTPKEYVESGDAVRDCFPQSRGHYLQSIEETVLSQLGQNSEDTLGFTLLKQSGQINQLCRNQLSLLSDQLFGIDNMLKGVHTDATYINLYERVVFQRCKAVRSQADSSVRQWCADNQNSDMGFEARVKVSSLKLELENQSLVNLLARYLNFDKPLHEQHAAVGRFLFEHRKELFDAELALKVAIGLYLEMEQFQQIALYGFVQDHSFPPADNILDYCFTDKLRNNPRAVQNLIRLLNEDISSIGTKQHESTGGKKWGHLLTALMCEEVGVIKDKSMPADFGRAIGRLLCLSDKMTKKISRYACPDRYKVEVGKTVIESFIKRYKTIWG